MRWEGAKHTRTRSPAQGRLEARHHVLWQFGYSREFFGSCPAGRGCVSTYGRAISSRAVACSHVANATKRKKSSPRGHAIQRRRDSGRKGGKGRRGGSLNARLCVCVDMSRE